MIFLTLQDSGPFKNVTHVRNETSGLLPLGKLRFDDVQEGKNRSVDLTTWLPCRKPFSQWSRVSGDDIWLRSQTNFWFLSRIPLCLTPPTCQQSDDFFLGIKSVLWLCNELATPWQTYRCRLEQEQPFGLVASPKVLPGRCQNQPYRMVHKPSRR